jgi:hypothetical protein
MKKLSFKNLILLATLGLNTLCAQQWDGLTYYSTMGSSLGYLIDTNSVVVKTYTFTGNTAYATHFMPGGNFFRSVQTPGNILTGGGMSGRIQKLDYNGNLLWDYSYTSATYCTHHDHCILPNGNVLVISYDVKNATDLSDAGSTSTLTSIRSEKIMELKPIGTNSVEVVWVWYLWDHLMQNVNPAKNNYYPTIVDHPELLNINYMPKNDWLHLNGIDYNVVLDQIVISSHNLNEWYVIDHSTTSAEAASHSGGLGGKGGDFLYRWGNPAAYQANGSAVLNVTHDAHWVPEGTPGEGNLAGINNKGVNIPSNKTTADQIQTPRVNFNYSITPGMAFVPSSYHTRHTSAGYTSNMGSSEQYPNGNQMICLASVGSIYEIDPLGNTLWTKSTGGPCPQAHRYSLCYLTNPAPAQPSISLSGSDLISTPASSYRWYFNGNPVAGATSQTLSPPQDGIYMVRTTDENGCSYSYSPRFILGTPTGFSTLPNVNADFEVFPNPANGTINLKVNSKDTYQVKIFSTNGQLIFTSWNVLQIDLPNVPEGLYFITVLTKNGESATKKFTIVH